MGPFSTLGMLGVVFFYFLVILIEHSLDKK